MGLPKETPEDVLVERAVMDVENLLQQQTAPEDTAAIFIEPVIGEGQVVSLLRSVSICCTDRPVAATSQHLTLTSKHYDNYVRSTVYS